MHFVYSHVPQQNKMFDEFLRNVRYNVKMVSRCHARIMTIYNFHRQTVILNTIKHVVYRKLIFEYAII